MRIFADSHLDKETGDDEDRAVIGYAIDQNLHEEFSPTLVAYMFIESCNHFGLCAVNFFMHTGTYVNRFSLNN